MNIITTLSAVCAAMTEPHAFHFADMYEENFALSADKLSGPVCICLPYTLDGEALQNFDNGMQHSTNYSVDLFFMRQSDFDSTFEQRHAEALQLAIDALPEFMTRLNTELPSRAYQVTSWRAEADKINLFDTNLDGILVSFTIPNSSTYCIPSS